MKLSTFKKMLPALRLLDKPPNMSKAKTVLITTATAGVNSCSVFAVADAATTVVVKALGIESTDFVGTVDFGKFNKLFGAIKEMPSLDYDPGKEGFRLGTAGVNFSFGKRTVRLDNAKLQSMDYKHKEFVPETGTDCQWTTDKLLAGLEYVGQAMSNDETRFHLCGMFFSEDGDLVATDGHRLHKYDYSEKSEDGRSFILPARAAKILIAAIKATGGGMVFSHRTEDRIRFVVDGGGLSFEITSKIIKSTFPAYKAVIPSSWESRCSAIATEFASVTKLLAKMSDSPSKGVEFSLNGALHLKGEGVSEEIEVINIEGEGFKFGHIGASGHYMTEAADLPERDVMIEFGSTDGLNPIVLKQGSYLAVVMPHRV